MKYSFTSRIRYSEIGEDGNLTLPGLINYFQDCSTFQSEAIGEGVAELKKRGCAWVLSAWQIHVRRYPSLGEAVKITTWASGFKGFLGMRNFTMETEDGEMLACANSIWSYVNMETGHPVRAPKETTDAYGIDDPIDEDFGERKVKMPEADFIGEPFPVRPHNLDTNHHVNNAQFISLAGECLPKNFTVRRMRAEYKQQAHLGDVLHPLRAETENGWFFLGGRGGVPPLENSGSGDLFFLRRRAPDRLVQTVVELCRDRLPKNMGIPAEQIQVLSPTRKGPCGTAALNRALQAALNPPERGKRQKQWGDMTFRVGDRVMQTRNNYDVLWEKEDGSGGSGIFNGDVGVIQDIDPGGELITLRFDDRTAVYTADLLSQLDMAYAVTVHKSQGSEYPAVILAAASAAPSLLVRGVLYTAITRARRLLILAGDDAVLAQMAANNKQQRRYSGLRRRLKEGYHEQ